MADEECQHPEGMVMEEGNIDYGPLKRFCPLCNADLPRSPREEA